MHSLFLYQTILILLEINIPVKHSQINRSLKGQAKAFKDSPFDSSLQTAEREPVDSRLQPRSSFGRATFHLQGQKSLTVSSRLRCFYIGVYTREHSGICKRSLKLRMFAMDHTTQDLKTPRFKAWNVVVKCSDAKVRLIRKIKIARLFYHVWYLSTYINNGNASLSKDARIKCKNTDFFCWLHFFIFSYTCIRDKQS